jgi:hypothetical protein
MSVLGIRFTTTAFSVALLDGTRDSPTPVDIHTTRLPKAFGHPQLLEWIDKDLTDYLKKYTPDVVVVKGAEPMAARSGAFVARCDFEAIAILAATRCGVPCKGRTVKATLAKILAGKGKARYLATVTPPGMPDFAERSTEEQDAIIAAWAALR